MNYNKNENFLSSGEFPFIYNVPVQIIETGQKGIKKPLIVYLHGFKENIEIFKEKCNLSVSKIEAFHLFIQGPYPIYESRSEKKVDNWGAYWYLYDGNQKQFLTSLEKTSVFIDKVINEVKKSTKCDRICLIGYSMGGYLAGYYALTRTKMINELIVIGARIKTEILNENWDKILHINILALHGKHDNFVDYKPQRNEINKLISHKIHADFRLFDQKHFFNENFVASIIKWLQKKGFILRDNIFR